MKPCNITSRSLIIARLSVSNKTIDQDLKCAISRTCVYYFIGLSCCLQFWYINHKKIKGKECIHVTSIKIVYTCCSSVPNREPRLTMCFYGGCSWLPWCSHLVPQHEYTQREAGPWWWHSWSLWQWIWNEHLHPSPNISSLHRFLMWFLLNFSWCNDFGSTVIK